MSPDRHGLVAPSDVAEMAGVSRAAVSNWRKRATDFPQPVGGTSGKPLFDRAEITSWLQGRGYEPRRDHGERAVWAVLNELRGSLRMDQVADLVLTLACVRKLSAQSPDGPTPWEQALTAAPGQQGGVLSRAVDDAAHRDPRWLRHVMPVRVPAMPAPILGRLLDVLNQTDVDALGHVTDYVLARIAAAQMRLAGEHGIVNSRVSALLGKLAAQHQSGTLYDPACGLGAAVVQAVQHGFIPERVIGHDIDVFAVHQAGQRAFLHGLALEAWNTDVLLTDPDPNLRADVIVAEPPMGMRWVGPELADRRWAFGTPPKNAAELAWIQHALAHLGENGRAYVVTAMGPLFRGGRERAIRNELVRQGCVECVIALPGKLLPHTSLPLALWVLHTPRHDTELNPGIRFIDGTDFDDIENIAPWWCHPDGAKHLDEVPNQYVPLDEVLAGDADLTPRRWIEAPSKEPDEIAAVYIDEWRAMTEALSRVQGSGESLRHFAQAPQSRVMTVGDLIEQGVLELRPGRRHADLPAALADLVVTPADVREHSLVLPYDEPDLSARYPDLTHEDDVLVTTLHTVRTLVDEAGGHLPSSGVYRLRIKNRGQIGSQYLAQVLTGAWNQRFQAGSTIKRASIKDLEVPVIPRNEQDRFRLALLSVQLLQEAAGELIGHARTVETSLLDALRYNVSLDGSQS